MLGAGSPDHASLRLKAHGVEDLQVLSTLLQDAIIPGEDMTFDRESNRFVIVANRFCWDLPPAAGLTTESGGPVYQRQLTGIQIHDVRRVQQTGMPPNRSASLFNLLAITAKTTPVDGGVSQAEATMEIDLLFSAGASLRLTVGKIDVLAEDFAASQPTMNQPVHDLPPDGAGISED